MRTEPLAAKVGQGLPASRPSLTQSNYCHPSYGHRVITKDTIDISKLPRSYQSNTPEEEHLLEVADNFSRQYSHLCPDRVPLFLYPLNECQVPVRPGRGGSGGGLGGRGWREVGPRTALSWARAYR